MEHIIPTSSCGNIKAYTSGACLENANAVILTCHDLGVNHNEFEEFLKTDDMVFLSAKMLWVHVDVPGQGDNEEDLPSDYDFPSLDKLAEGVFEVCEKLRIKSCVLFGEGAGANILARFAMAHDALVLGAVLIHCTGASAGFMESIKDKVKENPDEHELRHALQSFKANLRNTINPKNLNQYIQAYMNRTNLLNNVEAIKCPTLLMTGSLACHVQTVSAMYSSLKSQLLEKAELVVLDDIANPIRERPEKVSETLLYFLQGLGLGSGLMTRRMSNVRAQQAMYHRKLSMEESDKPVGVENLTFSPDRKYSSAADAMQADIDKFLASSNGASK